jgi:hypothetical protein
MLWLKDLHGRQIRLTDERQAHMEVDHPELSGQIDKIQDTLLNPDLLVIAKADLEVELFYRHYPATPVTEKYLCVVVKVTAKDVFIITAYFTDTIKRGEILWERK